jgi:hypothetical protein
MTTNPEISAKREREIEDVVARTMRAMADMAVEDRHRRALSADEAAALRAAARAPKAEADQRPLGPDELRQRIFRRQAAFVRGLVRPVLNEADERL